MSAGFGGEMQGCDCHELCADNGTDFIISSRWGCGRSGVQIAERSIRSFSIISKIEYLKKIYALYVFIRNGYIQECIYSVVKLSASLSQTLNIVVLKKVRYALGPMPYARRLLHLSEKGYTTYN